MTVCIFCLAYSFVMSTSTVATSKMYAYFSYKSNNAFETVGCFVAGEVTNYALGIMLAGTGAPGIALYACKFVASA